MANVPGERLAWGLVAVKDVVQAFIHLDNRILGFLTKQLRDAKCVKRNALAVAYLIHGYFVASQMIPVTLFSPEFFKASVLRLSQLHLCVLHRAHRVLSGRYG